MMTFKHRTFDSAANSPRDWKSRPEVNLTLRREIVLLFPDHKPGEIADYLGVGVRRIHALIAEMGLKR